MTSPILVRATTNDDAPALRAIEPREGLAGELLETAGDRLVVVSAWRDAECLGWCVLDTRDDAEGLSPQLSHLWVAPSARRQGVGHELTRWLEAMAREAGFKEMFLLVDPTKEAPAIWLYLDLDYSPTGHHRVGEVVETGERTHQAIYRKSLTLA